MTAPPLVVLDWPRQYRIVPSRFPPIDVFEGLVDPSQMEALWQLEALTDERLRETTGDITWVAPQDRVAGPGSSVVMAAFTHIGCPTRFSDGRYGVYYAAASLETAVRETTYHRARFLSRTAEPPGEIDMRLYVGEVCRPLHDIRGSTYAHLHHPDDYAPSQAFAAALRPTGAWGLVYRSVRHPSGECLAGLRPPAVSIPKPTKHLAYVWDGTRITTVYEKTRPLFQL